MTTTKPTPPAPAGSFPYSRELAMRLRREYGLHYSTLRKWEAKGWIPAVPATWATERDRAMQAGDELTGRLRLIFTQPKPLLHAYALGRLLEKKNRIPQLSQDMRAGRKPRHVLRTAEKAVIEAYLDSLAARFGLATQALSQACLHSVDKALIRSRLEAVVNDPVVNVQALRGLVPAGAVALIEAIRDSRVMPLSAQRLEVYAPLAASLRNGERHLLGVEPNRGG